MGGPVATLSPVNRIGQEETTRRCTTTIFTKRFHEHECPSCCAQKDGWTPARLYNCVFPYYHRCSVVPSYTLAASLASRMSPTLNRVHPCLC